MKKNDLIWYAFQREAVPEALQGAVDKRLNGPALTFGAPRPRESDVVVGFGERPSHQERAMPLLIVTNEFSTFEVFSWMATYAPNVFPMSQFARVISDTDWEFLVTLPEDLAYRYMDEDRWASLILGELLAQGDSDSDLSDIPFSRANACFSTAIARASLLYPKGGQAFPTCLNRLRKIESDKSFVRRPVSVGLLAKIWNTLHTHQYRNAMDALSEAAIFDSIDILLAHHSLAKTAIDVSLPNFPELRSDSIEERMLAFNKLLRQVGIKPEEEVPDPRTNAVIAAAAFLVGRGTSHLFLLRRLSKALPTAVVWFGVLAMLSGPISWDENWLRAVKGIEKHLRVKFNLEDPSLADLCWHEYAWLAEIYKKGEYFAKLSKNLPNIVSVEIVPGVACQMRLASSVSKGRDVEKIKEVEKTSRREKELELVVSQLLTLAAKAQELIPTHKIGNLEKQSSLFEGDALLSSKAPRKKLV